MPVAPDSVEAHLRALEDDDGFLPFDRFMEVALYTPGAGFYARERSPLGPRGDFYTAPHVHALYGATFAAHIGSILRELPADRALRIVEVGPGDGTLAADVLRTLAENPIADRDWEYVLVDRSGPRADDALDRASAATPRFAERVRRAESIGAEGPFSGVVLAHELLDAQPARRLRWSHGRWEELGVRRSKERWVEAARPIDRAPVPAISLDSLDDGTVIELQPSAETFVRDVADLLIRGSAIVVDYGMEESELLRGHSGGTLAAVADHRAVPDPLDAPGQFDLSVFVNFTRIKAAARRAGLELRSEDDLAPTLVRWGFSEEYRRAEGAARSPEEHVRLQFAAKKLLYGFERFRVLEFGSGPPLSPT